MMSPNPPYGHHLSRLAGLETMNHQCEDIRENVVKEDPQMNMLSFSSKLYSLIFEIKQERVADSV